MTRYDRTTPTWREDPAHDVVDELLHEVSEELGTDGPEETFGHPDESVVGRLVDDDEGSHPHRNAEATAWDSHDKVDLSAEEAAMHFVDLDAEDDLEAEPGDEEQLDR
ncbi:MAG: DUF5709 domain-containing protein [Actinomycetes bacterium]